MMRFITVLCLIAVFAIMPGSARGGGTFFLSGNYALTETHLAHNFTTHEVDDFGVSFGLMLPLTDHRFVVSYKGGVAFHGVTDLLYGNNPGPDDTRFYRNLDQYIASLNGLVIGTRVDLSDNVYVTPMIGIGVLVHIIYGNEGEGFAYGSFQTELSALLMREAQWADVGMFFSLGYVPLSGYLESADLKYTTFGVALSL
jgi:hypothetical protein